MGRRDLTLMIVSLEKDMATYQTSTGREGRTSHGKFTFATSHFTRV